MSVYPMLDRRELFLDGLLAERLDRVQYRVHHPERREVVLRLELPHESSNISCYQSIVRTPDRWLIYYRGGDRVPCLADSKPEYTANNCLCLAETTDGKNWRRVEVGTSPMGFNVVLDPAMTASITPNPVCPAVTTVFYDTNPAALPEERFKMIVTAETGDETHGMYLYVSPDGLRFTRKSPSKFAILSECDSQNLAFFDHEIGEYRIYHRSKHNGKRFIKGDRTRDFVTFTDGSDLIFDDTQEMELYTNQIQPYYRAPHLLIGTPMRYCEYDSAWTPALFARPGLDERIFRARTDLGEGGGVHLRYGTASTDAVVIASRDGVHFKRYGEAFVRPGDQLRGNWSYGDNFLFSGCIQTRSDLGADFPDEMSFYRTENAWRSGNIAIRRMALRLDGFVSLNAGAEPGEVVTRPLVFKGGRLALNVSTGVYGFAACEIQDETGQSIPGYSMQEAYHVPCDGHQVVMRWFNHGSDLRPLEGRAVRLRFRLADADLYSMQFLPYRPDPPMPEPGDRIDPALYADL